MKIFPTQKLRILFVCIGFTALLLIVGYLLKNDRYKASYIYQIYTCVTGARQSVLGLYQPIDFRVDFFGMTYEGRSGNIVDDHILYYGAHEKYILFFMRDVAASLGNQEVVFFDIGANIGQHSLFMSKHVKSVHAFEPYPPVLERFKKLVTINKINNISIHPVGLGNKNGHIPFYEPPDSNLGAGSYLHLEGTTNPTSRLPIVIGDEWLKKVNASKVDIVKCDIEGYEKLAFLGLRDTLERSRPIIVMELNLGLEESFQSIDDIYAVFPADYEFLFFCVKEPLTGHYELCQYNRLTFEKKESYEIVVFPKEKKGVVKIQNRK
jgi:FkbM family methyltransferase